MKSFSSETLAALAAGDVIVSGAVYLATAPVPIRVWGGHGQITIDGDLFAGVGDAGLVSASSGTLGGAEMGADLTLSGVDPDVMAAVDLAPLRGVEAVIWRLVFNGAGTRVLHAGVWLRGRVDSAELEDTPGGTSIIRVGIEGAARGLGRRSERMRTDADQRLISPTDGGFRHVVHAGEKTIYFGGQKPQRAGAAVGGGYGGHPGQELLDRVLV